MRDLDEICLGEHADHLLAQPAIPRLEILLRSAGPRIDLGVEVKIGLTQQIELFEILIVKQGAELAGQLPESRLPGIVEVARVHQAVDQIRLPQRNETIPLRRRGCFAGYSVHKTAVSPAGIVIARVILPAIAPSKLPVRATRPAQDSFLAVVAPLHRPVSHHGEKAFIFQIRVRVLAARLAEACLSLSLNMREQGMPDARCTRGLVCEIVQKSCTRAYRAAENIRHSLRNGLTAYLALTPEYRALLASVACGNWRSGPVGPCLPQDLTPTTEASGPHDFAVRFGAARPHVPKTAHGVYPALQSFSAHDADASTASHPNVR